MRLLFLTGQSGNSKNSPVDTFYFDIEQKVRRSPQAYGNVLSVVVNPGCFPGSKPAPRTGEPFAILRKTSWIKGAGGAAELLEGWWIRRVGPIGTSEASGARRV